MGCFKRTASKHVYYLGWSRSPAQVGCIRQVLRPGALGRPRGIGWRERGEGGSGGGTHVNPWLIHVNVWQNPLQYCKVISLQLIKTKKKKKEKKTVYRDEELNGSRHGMLVHDGIWLKLKQGNNVIVRGTDKCVEIIRVSEEGQIRDRSYDLPFKRNWQYCWQCNIYLKLGKIDTQWWELPDA